MMSDDALQKWQEEELAKLLEDIPEGAVYQDEELDELCTDLTAAAYRAGDAAGVKRTLERVAQYYESVCMDATAIEIRQMKP